MTEEAGYATLRDRLSAMARVMQTAGGDETTVKLIFDLREASVLLGELNSLLHLILNDMGAATNRDLAADGGVGDKEGEVWKKIEALANEIQTRVEKSNPEPKIA